MQYDEVVMGRRSIRGYKPDPVPKAVLREVIELAMRAPSSLNTQPWNFYVVAGHVLDRIRAGNTERNLAGVPHSREFRRNSKVIWRGKSNCCIFNSVLPKEMLKDQTLLATSANVLL